MTKLDFASAQLFDQIYFDLLALPKVLPEKTPFRYVVQVRDETCRRL